MANGPYRIEKRVQGRAALKYIVGPGIDMWWQSSSGAEITVELCNKVYELTMISKGPLFAVEL